MKSVAKVLLSFVFATVLFVGNGAMAVNEAQYKYSDLAENAADTTDPEYFSQIYEQIAQSDAISGYDDGTFRPFAPVNRAEFIKMLAEIKDFHSVTPTNCFSDVEGDEWYAWYVCYAKDIGLVSGYKDGTFRPGKTINMAEAMKILNEAYNISYEKNASPWYKSIVEAAIENKAVTPYRVERMQQVPQRYMSFGETLTRAKAFELILRYQLSADNSGMWILGPRFLDPIRYDMFVDPLSIAPEVRTQNPSVQSVIYNEESNLVAFSTTSETYAKAMVYDVVKRKYTILKRYDYKGKEDYKKVYIRLIDFSPSGYYVQFDTSGFEACQSHVVDTDTGNQLKWDLFGCPRVVWSPDRKEALVGVSAGFYPGYLKKSTRGNVNTLVDVIRDDQQVKYVLEGSEPLQSYNYINNEHIFVSTRGENASRYIIDSEGRDVSVEAFTLY